MAVRRTKTLAAVIVAGALAAVGLPGIAHAASGDAVVTLRTVRVSEPDNPTVAIVPFTDAIYSNCSETTSSDCMDVGGVPYNYRIGEIEVTVEQWVKFLNRTDPKGRYRANMYVTSEGSEQWPRFGQVNRNRKAREGHRYSVTYPEWKDKPYGFATFPRAARFANALTNGDVLSKKAVESDGFTVTTYRVRLGSRVDSGMYNLKNRAATRAKKSGFVIPSQDEWIKAAYYDTSGGGTVSYWKYPTNPGTFGEGESDGPEQAVLNPDNGSVTNSATQPLSIFHASGETAPNWCPAQVSQTDCETVNPFGLDETAYQTAFQGSLGSVGQAGTRSPWGTLDQGGNAVEWTDTITPPPFGFPGERVWRRLHGGVPNAPAYQLWISAVGLQPQDNTFYNRTYPWLGFRIGVIGNPK